MNAAIHAPPPPAVIVVEPEEALGPFAEGQIRRALQSIVDAANTAVELPGLSGKQRKFLRDAVNWCGRFRITIGPSAAFERVLRVDPRPTGLIARQCERKRQQQADPSCRYCGVRKGTTVDHVVPLSRGGMDHPSNLRIACSGCNGVKGDRTAEEWAADILAGAEGRPL